MLSAGHPSSLARRASQAMVVPLARGRTKPEGLKGAPKGTNGKPYYGVAVLEKIPIFPANSALY
jgi:hypothetical protein